MAWVFMAELQHVNIHCQAQCRVRWSGVKHTTTRVWSSGNVVCGVMNHISLSGTMMDKSGLANVRRTLPAGVPTVQFGVGRKMLWHCFSGLLRRSEEKC